MSTRPRCLVGVTLVIAALAAGCTSRGTGTPHQPPSQDGRPSTTVVLREFEFEPRPLKVKAGRVRFLLLNRGSVDHDFMIPSLRAMEHEQDLVKPGQSRVVELELKPGLYEAICTVPGHKDAGMVVQIEVTS